VRQGTAGIGMGGLDAWQELVNELMGEHGLWQDRLEGCFDKAGGLIHHQPIFISLIFFCNYSCIKFVNILKVLEFYRQKCTGLCRKICWGIPISPIFRALRIPE